VNITRLSIQRPRALVVFFLLIFLVGVYSYLRLNYELVPQFTPPVITVTTVYPGASPEEVQDKVSKVVEDALSSVAGVDLLTTLSQESFSLVRMELNADADVDLTLQDAQRKIIAVNRNLPDDAEPPTLTRFDFNDLPVMRMGVFSALSSTELNDLVKSQVVPALSKISGVAQVRILGSEDREVQVLVDPSALEYNGITILQILKALSTSNLDIPLGNIDNDQSRSTLKLIGRFSDLTDLNNLLIENPVNKKWIPLKDVATIDFVAKKREVISRINARDALGIDIKKQGDANAVEMTARVREELSRLEDRFSNEGLQFSIAQDTSEFTLEAARAVIEDLSLAVILVSIVMLLFLHSLRNSLIVLVSIPTSILATFITMFILGYSLNLLSLLGLSLAIGILVDDSIVVIENIYRHLEMGKSRLDAAYEGRMEIGFTAVSITLIDVVVFVPIILSSGMVADLLRQFSVVIVISTLMSLLVSFTLVPLIASRIGKLEENTKASILGKFIRGFENVIDSFGSFIASILERALKHRGAVLGILVILLSGAIFLIPSGFIGIEFTKAGDRGEFILELELDKNSSLERTADITAKVEEYLLKQPEVRELFSTIGITSSGRIEFNTSYLTELTVQLIDKNQRASATELSRRFKLELESSIPGLIVRPVEINILGLRGDDAVQVTLTGTDQDSLVHYAELLRKELDEVPGTIEVQSTFSSPATENKVIIDRNQLDNYNLNLAMVGTTLRTAISGNSQGKYQQEGVDYDINLKMHPTQTANISTIMGLTVMNNLAQLIPLSQIAETVEEQAPQKLERTNRRPSITLKSQVIGKPAGSVSRQFKQRIATLNLPQDIELIYGGQSKRTTDGLLTMAFAFIASIILVYFVLTILYNSFSYPFVVLLSIPMAVIGALLALALTQEALSIFSILGLVMLVGLVGKNAILVVDFAIKMIRNGDEVQKALIKATKLRFRPVLMTNLSMVIGLLPIALAAGAGSEWKNGLAWVLIGGLISSMLLTLIVVPVVFTFFAGKTRS